MNESQNSIISIIMKSVYLFFGLVISFMVLWGTANTAQGDSPWPWPWWIKHIKGEWSLEIGEEKLSLKIQDSFCSNGAVAGTAPREEEKAKNCLSFQCGSMLYVLGHESLTKGSDSFQDINVFCKNKSLNGDIIEVFIKPYFFHDRTAVGYPLVEDTNDISLLPGNNALLERVFFGFYTKFLDSQGVQKVNATYHPFSK